MCARLRDAREFLRLSQEEIASQIGTSRSRLASYEEKRAPIRADLALRLCHQFILGEEWLATGKGAMRDCLDLLIEPMIHRLPVDAPYGETYDKHLTGLVARVKAQAGGNFRMCPQPGDSPERMENLLLFFLGRWLRQMPSTVPLPEDFCSVLCASLIARGQDFTEYVSTTGKLPKTSEELSTWLFSQQHKAALSNKAARQEFLNQMMQRIRDTQTLVDEVLHSAPPGDQVLRSVRAVQSLASSSPKTPKKEKA